MCAGVVWGAVYIRAQGGLVLKANILTCVNLERVTMFGEVGELFLLPSRSGPRFLLEVVERRAAWEIREIGGWHGLAEPREICGKWARAALLSVFLALPKH